MICFSLVPIGKYIRTYIITFSIVPQMSKCLKFETVSFFFLGGGGEVLADQMI